MENNNIPVSARKHHDMFNTKFNLGFGSPKSDTYGICDAGKHGDIESHKRQVAEGFKTMKADRKMASKNLNVSSVTFDMEKTIPLPKICKSILFYLRQVWLYNADEL